MYDLTCINILIEILIIINTETLFIDFNHNSVFSKRKVS